jgi:hypothetical protein
LPDAEDVGEVQDGRVLVRLALRRGGEVGIVLAELDRLAGWFTSGEKLSVTGSEVILEREESATEAWGRHVLMLDTDGAALCRRVRRHDG